MNNQVVIDLETLGTGTDAAYISVGMARFDLDTCKVDDTSHFYMNVEWGSAMKERSFTTSALQFWLKQGEEASKVLLENPAHLLEVNNAIRQYIKKGDVVWGNGSMFDIGILNHAFEDMPPWEFWDINDVRTINNLGKRLFKYGLRDKEFKGIKHHALHDAIHEAEYICEVEAKIRERL